MSPSGDAESKHGAVLMLITLGTPRILALREALDS